jgi:hypothetical protein
MANSNSSSQLRNRITSNNPIETGRSIGDIPGSVARDIKDSVSAAPADFFNQLLGMGDYAGDHKEGSHEGEVKPYEKFTLYSSDHKDSTSEKPKMEHKPENAPAMNYSAEIAHSSERASKKENHELQYQIQEIVAELQRLVDSSNKIIQMEFGTVNVSSTPTAVGKYHTNFFSWMLTVIRTARQKVEDSGAWMAVAKGKGNRRGYKQSSKSLGTSFTQSNERNVATQTG